MKRCTTVSLPYWCVFDIPGKETLVAQLEEAASKADLWEDPQAAQSTLRRLTEVREEVTRWRTMERRAHDALEFIALAIAEEDSALEAELTQEAEHLEETLDDQEFRLMLQGPYDKQNAVLAIHAGAGGTEAQDWAQMLLRMYLRWAERHRYRADVVDLSPGEEAGVKSVMVEIEGPYAYGYLRGEKGVHRLVRLSPFDADHGRHTSFALVEVMPEVADVGEVAIDPKDLRIDVFRASSAGGQNVQKNSTAIRITHIPTGIVVSCQNERSQLQNKEVAMRILRARLVAQELEKQQQEQARIKGQHVSAGWANQIRSYVLHPYKQVKDLRTEYQTSATQDVLEGDLDDLIHAYLTAHVGED